MRKRLRKHALIFTSFAALVFLYPILYITFNTRKGDVIRSQSAQAGRSLFFKGAKT